MKSDPNKEIFLNKLAKNKYILNDDLEKELIEQSGKLRGELPFPMLVINFIRKILLNKKTESILLTNVITGKLASNLYDIGINLTGIISTNYYERIIYSISKNLGFEIINGDNVLNILTDLEEKYDVVVSFPPFGGRKIESNVFKENKWEKIHSELSNIIVLQSSLLLRKNGYGFFILPDRFFFDVSFLKTLEYYNIYIDGVFRLTPGINPALSISSNLVIISRKKPENIFVAEISSDNNIDTIIQNYELKIAGKVYELGMLTKLDEFRTYDRLLSKRKYLHQAHKLNLHEIPIKELTSEVNLTKNQFKDIPNSVYLPAIGNSKADTELDSLKNKHQNYIQLVIKENVALPYYVATFLNSDIGHMYRQSLTNFSTISRITKTNILNSSIYLPDLELQNKISNLERKVNNLYSNFKRIKDKFYKNPFNTKDIEKEVEKYNESDSFESWLDTLPFPLASILMKYFAEENVSLKKGSLFNFYEALAEFNSVIMLSAFSSDKEFYAQNKQKWSDKNKKYYEKPLSVHGLFFHKDLRNLQDKC